MPALAILYASALLGGMLVLVATGGRLSQGIGLTLLALTTLPILLSRRAGSVDWGEPVFLYSAVFFFTYVGSTVLLGNSEWQEMDYVADFTASFDRALILATLGYATFLVGYYSRWPARLKARLPRLWFNPTSGGSYPAIIGVVYLIGWVPRLVLLSNGQHLAFAVPLFIDDMGASRATFNYLAFFAFFGFTLATIYCLHAQRTTLWWLYIGIMVPLELLYAFLAGSKLFFIPIIAGPALAYNYLRRRIGLTHFLIPWAIFVFAVVPLNVAYRNSVTYGDLKLGTFFADFPRVVGATANELRDSGQPGAVELTAARSANLPILAAVVQNVPSLVPLQYGTTLFELPAAVMIPTVLWPTKYDFINEKLRPFLYIWGQTEDTESGVAITQIGEYYFNFHIPGIIVGMFLFGVLLKTYYVYLTDPPNPLALFIYISMWPFLVPWAVESWAFGVINFLVKNVALMLAIAWCLNLGRLLAPRSEAPG